MGKKKYKRQGQIYPRPSRDDPLRRFYRSLHRQKRDSVMAMRWLLEHGLFSVEKSLRIDTMLKLKELQIP